MNAVPKKFSQSLIAGMRTVHFAKLTPKLLYAHPLGRARAWRGHTPQARAPPVVMVIVGAVLLGVMIPAISRAFLKVEVPDVGLRHHLGACQTLLTPQVVAGSVLSKSTSHP